MVLPSSNIASVQAGEREKLVKLLSVWRCNAGGFVTEGPQLSGLTWHLEGLQQGLQILPHLAAPRMGEPRNLLASPGPFFRIPAATVVAIFSLELETEAAVVL